MLAKIANKIITLPFQFTRFWLSCPDVFPHDTPKTNCPELYPISFRVLDTHEEKLPKSLSVLHYCVQLFHTCTSLPPQQYCSRSMRYGKLTWQNGLPVEKLAVELNGIEGM